MKTMIEKVSFEKAKELMDALPEYILLDVREEEEYITGHAANSLLLPVDDIDESTAAMLLPDKNVPVLLYCRSGRRSKDAAHKLESMGYKTLYDIGSLIGWPYGLE